MRFFSIHSLFIAVAFFVSDTAVAAQQCASAGSQAKACGAKGKKSTACCPGLVCDGKFCAVVDPDTGGGGGECPQVLKVKCVVWAATGGNGQAIHAMAAIVDENNNPLNDISVTMDTTDPNGNTEKFVSTTFKAWVNYRDELDAQCGGDRVRNGVTSDKCYQQTMSGTYTASVTNIEMDGCSEVALDLGGQAQYTVDAVRSLLRSSS